MWYFSSWESDLSQRLGGHYSWAHGFSLYVLTGFVATAAHYILMWLLLGSGLPAVPASSLGFCAGAATRFLLSYFHVFSPIVAISTAMFRFIGALALQMGANSLLLYILLNQGLSLWVAQVTTTLTLAIFSYVACRVWVFR